jgi:hypothetical protein
VGPGPPVGVGPAVSRGVVGFGDACFSTVPQNASTSGFPCAAATNSAIAGESNSRACCAEVASRKVWHCPIQSAAEWLVDGVGLALLGRPAPVGRPGLTTVLGPGSSRGLSGFGSTPVVAANAHPLPTLTRTATAALMATALVSVVREDPRCRGRGAR